MSTLDVPGFFTCTVANTYFVAFPKSTFPVTLGSSRDLSFRSLRSINIVHVAAVMEPTILRTTSTISPNFFQKLFSSVPPVGGFTGNGDGDGKSDCEGED